MTLFSLFIVALSYGATSCMFSCMPLISPIMLATETTRKQSLKILLPISAGRISGYVLLSMSAYAGAIYIKEIISDKTLMNEIMGIVILFLAFRLWYAQKQSCCSTAPQVPQNRLALYLSGTLLSFSICAPVLSLMAVSATAISPLWAFMYGIAFGIGATLLWLLFFSVVLTSVLKESLIHLNQYKETIQKAATLFLSLIGISVFYGWISL